MATERAYPQKANARALTREPNREARFEHFGECDMRVSVSTAKETAWDAIIVGAGMGGSAAAFGLSERGWKVLVIERGLDKPTVTATVEDAAEDPDLRLQVGRWPTQVRGKVDGQSFDFFAPLGSGVGGSTLLYAAALDRFRSSDFTPRQHPDGGVLEWPFGFDDFKHWYGKAETALSVSGTGDPLDKDAETAHLGAPIDLSPRDADLIRRFKNAGLHPYRLHCGYHYVPECGPCLGQVCTRNCKRHAGNSFLEPARATGNVAILTEAEVLDFDATADRVEAVTLRFEGETHQLRAPVFILAAGTFFSPALLLKSANQAWPAGLGNREDQVGRNLMFHTSRFLALWSTRAHPHRGPGKSLVLRDFYDTPEGKFGEVQSVGLEASYGYVVYALRQMLASSRFASVPLLWHLARIPAFTASMLLGRAVIFDLLMEDLPYPENRVVLDAGSPSGVRFEYTVKDELRERYNRFSQSVKAQLNGTRNLFLSHGLSLNYGHPMGTCRIGKDPSSSVADANGKVHGLSNLFIADGSFMPSAGGTNPSLTIAAHGLRLASGIDDARGPKPG